MKRNLLTVIFLLTIQASVLYAQSQTIPSPVDSIFKSAYSKAIKTEWQTDGVRYSVTFSVSNGQRVHIVYDTLGRVQEKYMEFPRNSVPQPIADYLKENYPNVSVANYWVKQKGIERIYKLQLNEEIIGSGSIVGSNYGQEKADSTQQNHSDSQTLADSSSNKAYEVIYFDRFGNSITSDDALSGVYVARQKVVAKPASRYYVNSSKKNRSGNKRRK